MNTDCSHRVFRRVLLLVSGIPAPLLGSFQSRLPHGWGVGGKGGGVAEETTIARGGLSSAPSQLRPLPLIHSGRLLAGHVGGGSGEGKGGEGGRDSGRSKAAGRRQASSAWGLTTRRPGSPCRGRRGSAGRGPPPLRARLPLLLLGAQPRV